jgi:hypothetical protein
MVVYQPWPRLRINFDNDGAVFVLYPWGAGGKFVINSLAVSARAVLQDASLAEQQLNKELSTAQKKQIILDRLAAEKNHWQDLHFSVDALTGVNERCYIIEPPSTAQYWPWNHFMSQLSRTAIKWFADIHDAGHLSAYLTLWPNARVINMVNSKEFLEWRRVNYNRDLLQKFWQTIRDPSWPIEAPETWNEFITLPNDIQKELLFVRHGDIFQFIQHPEAQGQYEHARLKHIAQVCEGREVFEFHTKCLLDTSQYLETIARCYSWTGLYDFDKTFLECYHKQWLEKIQQVPI